MSRSRHYRPRVVVVKERTAPLRFLRREGDADPATLAAIRTELMTARGRFPSCRHAMAALTEEVGELAQAMIDNEHKRPGKLRDQIRGEAIQVAVMAIRVLEEGDTTFPRSLTPRGRKRARR